MTQPIDRYSLRPPRSNEDWAAYHLIRRDSIFALHLPQQAYDPDDPDEFKPGNLPHVLSYDGEIIGAIRIDLIDQTRAGLRLIAIKKGYQQCGHGKVLLRLAENIARALGREEITINSHPTALTFY